MQMFKVMRIPVLILLPLLAFSYVWVSSDSVGVYMKNYGEIEVWGPVTPGDTVKQIDRISVLVGTDAPAVFDYYEDADVDVASMLIVEPALSDMEGFTSINNYYSFAPPDIHAAITVYAWDAAEYVIIKIAATNIGAESMDARIGLDVISQIEGEYDGVHTWLPETNIVDMSRAGENHIGLKFLSHTMTSLSQFVWFSNYSAAGEDAALWGWMSAAEIDTMAICTNPDDGLVSIPSADVGTIAPDESVDFFYCIARGQPEDAMVENVALAETAYSSIFTVGVDDVEITPETFTLSQNYPNPFNPTTQISFTLPVAGQTSIDIYTLRGEHVLNIQNDWMLQGSHSVNFSGAHMPSGIYIYRLTSGSVQIQKKMTLLK